MWVFCAGMIRAGSTLQYQIASALVERHGLGKRVPWYDRHSHVDMLEKWKHPDEMRVAKTHVCSPILQKTLANSNAITLYIYRDLRDVWLSAKRMWKLDASTIDYWIRDNALADYHRWQTVPRLLISRYEDAIADLPREVRRIAAHLGIPVAEKEIASMAREFSVKEQKKHLPKSTDDDPQGTLGSKYDPVSQLHEGHINKGAAGGWRKKLSPNEILRIENIGEEWLKAHGYETVSEQLRGAAAKETPEEDDTMEACNQCNPLSETLSELTAAHEDAQAKAREEARGRVDIAKRAAHEQSKQHARDMEQALEACDAKLKQEKGRHKEELAAFASAQETERAEQASTFAEEKQQLESKLQTLTSLGEAKDLELSETTAKLGSVAETLKQIESESKERLQAVEDRCRATVKELETKLVQHKSDADKLLTASEEALSSTRAEKSKLSRDLSRAKRNAENRKHKYEADRNALLRDKITLGDALERAESELRFSNAELTSLRPEAEWLHAESTRLASAQQVQQQKVSQLTSQLRASGERSIQLEREMLRLNGELKSFEQWGEDLKRELERVGRLLQDAVTRGDKAERELELARHENKQLSSERKELRQALTVIRQVVRESEFRRKHRFWLFAVKKLPQLTRFKRHFELPRLGSEALPAAEQAPLPVLGKTATPPDIAPPDRPETGVSTLSVKTGPAASSQRFKLSPSSQLVIGRNACYWEPVIDALHSIQTAGERTALDLMPELTLAHGERPEGPWVAAPAIAPDLPRFWSEVNSQSWLNRRDWQQSSAWESCRAIIGLSDYASTCAAAWAEENAQTIRLPIPQGRPDWQPEVYENSIIQPVEPQMRVHGIHMLGLDEAFKRVAWVNDDVTPADLIEKEAEILTERNLLFPFMSAGVQTINPPTEKKQISAFSNSIFFMHLHDTFCPITLLECIASATPVVVNAIPAVRELLGADYPLYFFSYPDAAAKIQNRNLVTGAHDYLKKLPCRQALTMEAFLSQMEAL